jgi:phosphoglycolate phosphatase
LIKGLLFDLDGTLLDSAPDFVYCLNSLLEKYQKPPTDADLIRSYVSDGSAKLVKLGFKIEEDHPEFEKLKKEFLDSYKNNLGKFSNLFCGASELIEKIKLNNLKWGIVTNKPYEYASKIIEEISDLSSCMTLVCPDHLKKAKPSPEGILLACNQLNLNPKEVIYFGDHQKDLIASRTAGTLTAACTYGYALQSSDLENNDIEVRNLLEFAKTNFESLDEQSSK